VGNASEYETVHRYHFAQMSGNTCLTERCTLDIRR
jgi:hypothetical protein